MKNVIITGSTGMIGCVVLNECIKSPDIRKVISFTRRPTGIVHKKLTEIIISDFKDYSQYEKMFDSIDTAYFCIGVYTGQVTKDKFKEITVDYTTTFADMLKKNSPKARFCFLSGAGADRTEKSRMSFAKYKGMAENYLLRTLENVSCFRPGYIYPVEKRKEPNITYKISRALYPVIKLLGKNASIKSTELGLAMFKAGIEGTKEKILENKDIIELVEN